MACFSSQAYMLRSIPGSPFETLNRCQPQCRQQNSCRDGDTGHTTICPPSGLSLQKQTLVMAGGIVLPGSCPEPVNRVCTVATACAGWTNPPSNPKLRLPPLQFYLLQLVKVIQAYLTLVRCTFRGLYSQYCNTHDSTRHAKRGGGMKENPPD